MELINPLRDEGEKEKNVKERPRHNRPYGPKRVTILFVIPHLLRFSLPTPPKASRTTSQSAVDEIVSLISSAVSTSPLDPALMSAPTASVSKSVPVPVPVVRDTPCAVTTRFRIASCSTSISGSGNGIFKRLTTLGWCGVGERVATFRRTEGGGEGERGAPAVCSMVAVLAEDEAVEIMVLVCG